MAALNSARRGPSGPVHNRPNGRGRIQKRRVDRDGDLVMQSPAKRQRSSKPIKDPAPKALPQPDVDIKQLLQNVLDRRYNAESKLLDLSALATDPELQQVGMFDATSTQSKFFPALMKICDSHLPSAEQKRDFVESVSLAGNNLPNIAVVTTLAQTFPDLKNLDLSGNNFKDLKALIGWKRRFKNLDLLILENNPFQSSEPGWESQLIEWYPKLRTLNGVQVRTDEQVTLSELCCTTRMTEEYARQCLDASAWNLESALSTFETYKSTLPQEAFTKPERSEEQNSQSPRSGPKPHNNKSRSQYNQSRSHQNSQLRPQQNNQSRSQSSQSRPQQNNQLRSQNSQSRSQDKHWRPRRKDA